MPPDRVAEIVFDAIRKERFYIVTDPRWMEAVRLRTDKLMALENPVSAAPVLMPILTMQG